MKKLLFIFLLMIGNAYAQSSLPKCPGSPVYNQDISGWDNCFGTYSYAGETYVGEFKDGKYHGRGTATYGSGYKYTGEYWQGVRQGQGTFIDRNGETYVGEFKNFKFHGQGALYAANGSIIKQGRWENDEFISLPPVKEQILSNNASQAQGVTTSLPACKGNNLSFWKNCYGSYIYDNGSEYVGEFKNGAPNGRGALTSPNGNKYIGQWLNGVRHGVGVQTYTDNRQMQGGIWANGVFSGGNASISNDGVVTLHSRPQTGGSFSENQPFISPPQINQSPPLINQGRRLALVIGNASYKVRPLLNPRNDADDISRVLRSTGFEIIDLRDATLAQMRAGVRQFGERLMSNDVGLVYYSGHGIEVRGKNYFIPVNADIRATDEVADQALDVSLILAKMDTAKKGVNILIVDACRDDPFGRSFRSNSRGLATMDAPQGTLIAYATAPGSVAADGTGRNSPFTKHLVRAMQVPNTPIELMFKEVRRAVREETKNQQTPWENSSLIGNFYFSVKK